MRGQKARAGMGNRQVWAMRGGCRDLGGNGISLGSDGLSAVLWSTGCIEGYEGCMQAEKRLFAFLCVIVCKDSRPAAVMQRASRDNAMWFLHTWHNVLLVSCHVVYCPATERLWTGTEEMVDDAYHPGTSDRNRVHYRRPFPRSSVNPVPISGQRALGWLSPRQT